MIDLSELLSRIEADEEEIGRLQDRLNANVRLYRMALAERDAADAP